MFLTGKHKKKIIVHIGLPKTGSTALQQLLFQSRDELLKAKVLYSGRVHQAEDPKHNFLIDHLKKNTSIDLSEEQGFARAERIVLSNEALSNELYLHGPEKIRRLATALSAHGELELCLVLRQPGPWLKSYYKQAVINQPVKGKPHYQSALSIDEFAKLEPVARLLDQANLIQDVGGYFDAALRTFRYEETAVATIAQWCAGQPLSQAQAASARHNESLSSTAVEVMRQLNAGIETLEEKYAWSCLLQQASGSEHAVLKTLSRRASEASLHRLDMQRLQGLSAAASSYPLIDESEFQRLTGSMRDILVEIQNGPTAK